MQQLRLTFCKGDLLAAALVAATAIIMLIFLPRNAEAGSIQVYHDNRLIYELPLSKDRTVTVSGRYENAIAVRGGRVAITDSDCPGEDCVHSGWIEGVGRSIVCLPNRVEVRINGASDVDFIVG